MPEDIVLWIVVLLSVTASGAVLFAFLRQQKRRRTALLTTISGLGSRSGLSFTGQEILSDSIIGFDGLKKKILVLEDSQSVYRWYTISLEEVSHCTVQKTYRAAAVPSTGLPAISGYVDRVELIFHCRDREEPLAVPFYSAASNEAIELPALEARARNWQRFLTKLLPAQDAGRA